MKKLNIILLLLGAAFLAWLIWSFGAGELWRQVASLGWGLVPFILAEGVAEMVHTIGWRRCLNEPYRSLSWWVLFQIRMAGYALNYPTASVGGEVTKAALLASHHPGPGAVSGVLIEKVCFAFAQVLFVALGCLLIVGRVQLPRPLWISMLCSGALLAAGILTFFLLQRYGKLGGLLRWLAQRKTCGRAVEKAATELTGVDEALSAFYRERPLDMWLAIGWHLLGFSVSIAQTWFFLQSFNRNGSLVAAATAVSLGMWFDLLTFAVPLNVGSLEGSRIVSFQAIGCTALVGMTYGVALRLAQLFCAGVGLAFYGLLTARETDSPAPETSASAETSPATPRLSASCKDFSSRISLGRRIRRTVRGIIKSAQQQWE